MPSSPASVFSLLDSDSIIEKKKRCSRCYKIKHRTEYYKNKKNKDGLEYLCKKCSSLKNRKHNSSQVPWRKQKKGFPYKGLNDPKYIKDKAELFNRHGNGWWWTPSSPYRKGW